MQPISRVKPSALMHFGNSENLAQRPNIAIKISQCIAEWAEIESILGIFLGMLLDANTDAALAMYTGVENRSSQMKMLDAAAKVKMNAEGYEAFTILLSKIIRPAMRERDKLAHWCWGFSPNLPDALLLSPPSDKTVAHMRTVEAFARSGILPENNLDRIFVVTDADLERTFQRLGRAKEYLLVMAGAVWPLNSSEVRGQVLQRLLDKPEIRKERERLALRNKNPLSPAPPPPRGDA